MAASYDDKIAEGKLDLVPMIDCIMLLIIFFVLTTKFSREEQIISSVLPTKGQTPTQPAPIDPKMPVPINVAVYPLGFQRNEGGAQVFQERWQANPNPASAILKVGNLDAGLIVEGAVLNGTPRPEMAAHLDRIHAYLREHLARFETGASDRSTLPPIVLHCFSGLDWKYALAVYDGIRAYEAGFSTEAGQSQTVAALLKAREVTFAPPRIRNYHPWEQGQELTEIVSLK